MATTTRASLISRLFWTFGPAIAIVVLAPKLTLPGVDRNALEHSLGRPIASFFDLSGGSMRNFSVFALGLTPVIAAYGLVEIIAMIVPRLARLRHANPAGRVKLDRAARIVALVLAAFQAWGIAKQIDALDASTSVFSPEGFVHSGGVGPTLTRMASLLGGVCVSFIVASFITRRGIANGIVLISLFEALDDLVRTGGAQVSKQLLLGNATPLQFVGVLVVVCAPLVATWLALRDDGATVSESGTEKVETPYREARSLALRPIVPIPASAIAPLAIASSLLMFPATLSAFISDLKPLQAFLERGDLAFTITYLVLTLSIGYAFARLLHRPREMADLVARLGGANHAKAEAEGRSALARALPPTFLLTTLILSSAAAGELHTSLVSPLVSTLLVAVVMDAKQAIASATREPDLIAVWQERRRSAIPVLRAVLEAEGITVVHARGIHVLGLLQIFVPYAYAEILVRAEDAERASAILRHLLLGEAAPAPAPEKPLKAAAQSAGKPAQISRMKGLAATALVPLTIFGALSFTHMHRSSSSSMMEDGRLKKPRPQLLVVFVDDDVDVLAAVDERDAPPGIEVRMENAPVGNDNGSFRSTARRNFATTKLTPGETPFHAANDRLKPWLLNKAPLPVAEGKGHRWGFEPTEDYNPDTGASKIDGVRSFVLLGDPILTTDDVVDAQTSVSEQSIPQEVYVAITLSEAGADRFEKATGKWINRRIAIVIDGMINSAPVVRSKITGGRVSITMGAGDLDKQLSEAKKLARGLSGNE